MPVRRSYVIGGLWCHTGALWCVMIDVVLPMRYFDISVKYCALVRKLYNLMMWHCDVTIGNSGIVAGHCGESIGHCHGLVKLSNATINIVIYQRAVWYHSGTMCRGMAISIWHIVLT